MEIVDIVVLYNSLLNKPYSKKLKNKCLEPYKIRVIR